MTAIEVIGFLAAIAFFVISAIRNIAKQQRQELKHAQQKAKEVHTPAPHKPVVQKKVNKERPLFEELKMEKKPLRVQKKSRLPGGCSLRAAILSKEILDPPIALR